MLMLKIEFIMEDILEKKEKLTGFELGSIKIYFNGDSYILKDSKYYFMVFVSAIELLSCICHFYSFPNKNQLKFIFCDSSFHLKLKRLNDNLSEFYIMNYCAGQFNQLEILQSVYEACKKLYTSYKNQMEENNFFLIDMNKLLNDFEAKFNV